MVARELRRVRRPWLRALRPLSRLVLPPHPRHLSRCHRRGRRRWWCGTGGRVAHASGRERELRCHVVRVLEQAAQAASGFAVTARTVAGLVASPEGAGARQAARASGEQGSPSAPRRAAADGGGVCREWERRRYPGANIGAFVGNMPIPPRAPGARFTRGGSYNQNYGWQSPA